MKKVHLQFATTLLYIVLLMCTCTTESPVAVPELLDGNCVGIIKDLGGNPVKGATVLFIPEAYVPCESGTISGIDSTVSDEFGRYGFSVAAKGVFNLLSSHNHFRALRSKIIVTPEVRVALKDEILVEPGSFSGTLRLQGAVDHRKSITLIIGTNRYIAPSDTSGRYCAQDLAPGRYSLRMLATDKGYAMAETTITVVSSINTHVPDMQLAKLYTPTIDTLHVAFDTAMMTSTLSWDHLDTSVITGYNIYLNRSMNLQPVVTVSDTVSTWMQDVIIVPADTLRYQVAALNNDGSIGPFCAGNTIIKKSLLRELPGITVGNETNFTFIDSRGYFYFFEALSQPKMLKKVDSLGNVVASVAFPDSIEWFTRMRVDPEGNVYFDAVISNNNACWLVKLHPDLSFCAQLRLPDKDYWWFICGNSTLILLVKNKFSENQNIRCEVTAARFEGDLVKTSEMVVAKPAMKASGNFTSWNPEEYVSPENVSIQGDTLYVFTERCYDWYQTYFAEVQSFENNLRTLLSPKMVVFIDNRVIDSVKLVYHSYCEPLFLGFHCAFIITAAMPGMSTNSLWIFNKDSQLLCKTPWDSWGDIVYCDDNGMLYFINNAVDVDNIIRRVSLSSILSGTR